MPTYVNELDDEEQFVLRKFLPRFNTHHKQFFSPNPVFVEGYTDQQIISILFEKIGINIGASGSCIIDDLFLYSCLSCSKDFFAA